MAGYGVILLGYKVIRLLGYRFVVGGFQRIYYLKGNFISVTNEILIFH